MDTEQLISNVEAQLLGRELSSVERWVFEQTWEGKSYLAMAHESSYSMGYLKAVGANLWGDLSSVIGITITKKNLRWVLRQQFELEATVSLTAPSRSSKSNLKAQTKIYPPKPTHPTHLNPISSSAAQPPRNRFKAKIDEKFIPFPSGPVPIGSPFYIERRIERQAYGELQNPGCLLRIHGPSKTGKTSLLIRLLEQAKSWEYKAAFIDFQTVEHSILSNLDTFLRWFCVNVTRQIRSEPTSCLAAEIESFWDDDLGSSINCTEYLEEKILKLTETPIILALNEVNHALSHPETMQDFLSLLRFWHEQSKHQKLWEKLRLILVYSSECYIPLRIDRSPFNVGRSLRLPPLTVAEIQTLAVHHGFDWAQGSEGMARLSPLVRLVGGNPYLTRLALYYLYESSATIEDLLQQALAPEGPYRNHLRERESFLEQAPQLADALNWVFNQKSEEDFGRNLRSQDIYHLESAGFVRYEGSRLVPSCELYRQYFEAVLV